MNRLFIALKIPEEIREKIISLRDAAIDNSNKYRWEAEDKIHLTLKFIGNVNEEFIEPLGDSLNFISDYNSFNCRLIRFGFFYQNNQATLPGREAKILWMGLSVDEKINQLVERINKELEAFSIAPEKRKFQPHLTLKRLKGDEESGFVKSFENYKVPDIQFKAGEVALMKSDLLPHGSKYTEIKKYKLK
ncbi:MAG: RNA 2',3'-cyclic phosphodiesterase [Ignavibacteriaceae bacterium]|nr:RNA 2',3'-cyclic phosphodiesterase [Ignavibacteriaceae bacterium]